jgi:predicted nucleic acid-binding protein
MYWPLPDKTKPAQLAYAAAVLESPQSEATATVPLLWHPEAIHILVQAERGEPKAKRRKPIGQAVTQAFWETITALEFETVSILHGESVTALARRYGLSAYDAAYLDIAMRRVLPLASLAMHRVSIQNGDWCGLFPSSAPQDQHSGA